MTLPPQRLNPRFATLANLASRVPGGLRLLRRVGGSLMWDTTPTHGDRLDPERLHLYDVAIIGFPRSGTTYLAAAAQFWIGGHAKVLHLHDTAAISVVTEAAVPVIVAVRDPRDTIISWCLYNSDAPTLTAVLRRLVTFEAWHRAAIRHVRGTKAAVVEFDDFTADPAAVPEAIGLAREVDTPVDDETVLHAVAEKQMDVAWQLGNLPSTYRRQVRADYERVLDHPACRRTLNSAVAVQQRLIAYAVD